MKLSAALLLGSVSAAGRSRRGVCENAPTIEIRGDGNWVADGEGSWKIECNGATGIAPSRIRIGCSNKKGWVARGATTCYNPPAMPDFLDGAEITAADTKIDCHLKNEESGRPMREPRYKWKEGGMHMQTLFEEALKYIEGYARALTESDGICRSSDNTMTQTNTHTYGGPEYMCIMDRRDMQLLVKHIYFVLYHPEAAMKCFHGRENVGWMYGVGGSLEASSPVAQWMTEQGRVSLEDFYKDEGQVPNDEVRAIGAQYAQYFSDMVTGDDMQTPDAFPFDITANALPNLWASAGWVPMYAWDSARNNKNFIKTRGSYGYAEVMGHWGLLRIGAINGEEVGAEIGMVNQGIDTFYPFHNHAIPEIYYTIRKPACAEEFNNFAIRENNPLLETIAEDSDVRTVEFDGSDENADAFWIPTSPKVDDLIYFHANTIHAFHIKGENCHDDPIEKAIVTVWARSMAHDRRNDYGTTLLCESSANPDTPALKENKWQCDLSQTKWRRSTRSVHNPFGINE